MVEIEIDGKKRSARLGANLLETLLRWGIDVPHLCHDNRLLPAAVCRLCVVEIDGNPQAVSACNLQVRAGMLVRTDSPALIERRRGVLQMLARSSPPSASESGQASPFARYLAAYGLMSPSGEVLVPRADDARVIEPDESHPYLRVDMSHCIHCRRCVRICDEVQGQSVWHLRNRGDQSQIVPDSETTLLASTCVSCGACADTCPTGAIEDKTTFLRGLPTKVTRTTCPYCGTGCEMDVGTRDQHIISSKPALDSPTNKGHLCVKGRYAFEFVHATDRVTKPLIRRSGVWDETSWDTALGFAAEQLKRILATKGPDSIGVLGSARATNEDNYVAQKFARVVLGTNNVDCCARVCHGPTAAAMNAMLGTGAATASYDDIERTELILVCGANATESHPVVGVRIRNAARRGVPLIVIDPRKIELTRDATIHLQLRVGTNVPLIHSLCHTLVAEGLCNTSFLKERVSDPTPYFEFLGDFSPEAMASTTGVPARLVREAARALAGAGRAMLFHGLGVTEHTQGTEGVMCLVNLALLTGNLGKPGAGVNPLRGQNNVQGAAHMGCEPNHLAGYADLGKAASAFSELWGTPVPTSPGKNMMKMLDAAKDGTFAALIAIGYDILLTNADANDTAKALSALDFLVVQDMFMNETAMRRADVFLPACSSFEKDGTFMSSERRVQRVRQLIEPLGSSRPDWEITSALAEKMGYAEAFAYRSAEEIWEEIRRGWPAGAGISYARLEHGGLQWPCPDESHPGTPLLHEHSFGSSKRATLRNVPFLPSPERTNETYPFLLITGRSLYQFNAGTMTARTKNSELRPEDTLGMCPADAKRLQLRSGEKVRIRSRYGEAILRLSLSDALKPGEVFATFHSSAAFVNKLTSPHRDSVVDTPEYKVTAVSISSLDDRPQGGSPLDDNEPHP